MLAATGLMMVALMVLYTIGQPLWCEVGDIDPWSANVNSSHNSQHLADPYTLTHLLHGITLYWILWWLLGAGASAGTRFVIAMGVEVGWEIFENTDFIIERYRTATISLDYFGDSVINSGGDIAACALGYFAAMLLPGWLSVATFVTVEAVLLLWIHDSLLMNILMLVAPFEAITSWQAGGG